MKTIATTLLLTLTLVTLRGAPFADSSSEFSNVQGSNNWYYGYYNATADATPGYDPINDFIAFSAYGPGNIGTPAWRSSGSFWTEVARTTVHPNSDGYNVGKTAAEHWAVRRWISDVTSLVRIHGHLAKYIGGGDGVTFTVFLNGRKIFERTVAGNDTVGADYSLGVGLQAGDLLDFAVSDAGGILNDTTSFTAIVDAADFVVTSSAAIELGTQSIADKTYQLLHSLDLAVWNPIGNPFVGTGDWVYHVFSIRELGSPGYFKAEILP